MNKAEALKVLIEMQLWRRGDPPYDYDGKFMPYTGKTYGEALDIAIKHLESL